MAMLSEIANMTSGGHTLDYWLEQADPAEQAAKVAALICRRPRHVAD